MFFSAIRTISQVLSLKIAFESTPRFLLSASKYAECVVEKQFKLLPLSKLQFNIQKFVLYKDIFNIAEILISESAKVLEKLLRFPVGSFMSETMK